MKRTISFFLIASVMCAGVFMSGCSGGEENNAPSADKVNDGLKDQQPVSSELSTMPGGGPKKGGG